MEKLLAVGAQSGKTQRGPDQINAERPVGSIGSHQIETACIEGVSESACVMIRKRGCNDRVVFRGTRAWGDLGVGSSFGGSGPGAAAHVWSGQLQDLGVRDDPVEDGLGDHRVVQ